MDPSQPSRVSDSTWEDLDEAPLAFLYSKPDVSVTQPERKTKKSCNAAIKYGVNVNNALCQESVELCKFCSKTFSNKLDALVHNATHSTVSLKQIKRFRSYKSYVTNNISIDLTDSLNSAKYNDRINTEKAKKEERARIFLLHHATYGPKDNTENVKQADEFQIPKPRDMSDYYKQMIKVKKPKAKINRGKPLDNPSAKEESKKQLTAMSHIANCKVNLEPLICDVDSRILLQKIADGPKPNANIFPPTFTTNNSSAKRIVETDDKKCIVPDILSSFTTECRVVLDTPLLKSSTTEAVSKTDVVNSDKILDSFTAECKVILGTQMIFDEDPASIKLLSRSQPATESLPTASGDLSDDDEPLVNILDLNDYTSLIKPIICYCSLCPQVFPNRFELYKHQASHLSIQFTSKRVVRLRPFSLLKSAAWNDSLEHTKPTKHLGIYCSVCEASYASVEDLMRHAAVHLTSEELHPAIRYVKGEMNPTFTACETCNFSYDKPRRLIGRLVVKLPTVLCSLCNRPSLRACLFLGSRTVETKHTPTPVIDLCDDEPEDVADMQDSRNSGVNTVNSSVQNQVHSPSGNVILCQVIPLSVWSGMNTDPEMATLTPNTVSSHNSNSTVLESILHPANSDIESALVPNIISKNDSIPSTISKKDFINTVWEHALTDTQSSVSDDTVTNVPNTFVWGQANRNDIGNAASDNVNSTRVVAKSGTDISVPRTGIKERIAFEDDIVTAPKPVDNRLIESKQKAGRRSIKITRPQSQKEVERYTYKIKQKTITNADRLRNIKRNLQKMRAGSFKFSKTFKAFKKKLNE